MFLPKDIDLDSVEMDETEREVEYFKRYCLIVFSNILKCGHISEISRAKTGALLTACIKVCLHCRHTADTNLKVRNLHGELFHPHTKLPIVWIPIGMTVFCHLEFR